MNSQIIIQMNKLVKMTEEECFTLQKEGKKKEANVCRFKIKNYKKGIETIKDIDFEITSSKQLIGKSGIGKGIQTRIDEILENGYLQELKNYQLNNNGIKSIEVEKLMLVTGIGTVKAHDLYQKGFTLDKLLNQMKKIADDAGKLSNEEIIEKSIKLNLDIHNLTHHQIIGLKYFNDINERIPRNEITKIETKLKKIIYKIDEKLIVTICGSYRRGLSNSGDIDVLITHADFKGSYNNLKIKDDYLITIVKKLTEKNLIIDHLTSLGTTKYMGVCRLNSRSKGRRIDIRFVPLENYIPALLYFTGSKDFNTRMRGEALKQGYTINEYGIYKFVEKKIKGKKTLVKGDKIFLETEKDAFDLLGMEYLEPHQRIN